MTEKEEALELYKVMVSTITANEARRQQAATVYLSLLAAVITAFGAIENLEAIYAAWPAGVIAMIWFSTVRYFGVLAEAKFKVINELEEKFEYAPFTTEWRYFKEQNNFGLVKLDMIVPALVAVFSLGYLLFWFVRYFSCPVSVC